MVKIPELAKDGQNWKIYHVKFLEVAATYDCLEVLAGRPYKGEDWDGCNALLCCTFMESVPPSIYFKIRCRTMHENFKYLAKCFRDSDPIPCANKLQCAGTAAPAETPDNCPTSADAATEQHAHAEWNTEDLSTAQDVNDRNVRCMEDPHTSTEALVEGTSAKCTETTPVILKSMPHEMQTELQSSPPLTPRLPTDGEPSRCKWEAADSIVMAEHTVKTAKPTEIADVNGMALLGREPAERARGIGKGDETEHEAQSWLQESKLLCREIDQCSGIANGDIPITNGLPLKGEWTAYLSGKTTDLKGVELEGREGSTDKLTELLTMSVKLYVEDGSDILHVYLGSRADGSMGQTEVSEGQADGSRGLVDAPSTLNSAETAAMSDGEGTGTYLATGDLKRLVHETDGNGVHADTLSGCGDTPSIETKAIKPENETETVRTRQMKEKPQDLPYTLENETPKPIR